MIINKRKLELALARRCKSATDFRGQVSSATITRVRQGRDIGTKTVGKLAYALGVDVTELIEQDGA